MDRIVRLHRMHRVPGLVLAVGMAIAMAGCVSRPADVPPDKSRVDRSGPFEVSFPGQPVWRAGKEGFDPSLPGYHFAAGIASVRLVPRTPQPPAKLVIAIHTSAGMAPHLDSLRLSVPGIQIQDEPFNPKVGERVMVRGEAKNLTSEEPKGTFFSCTVVGNAVHVTLQPAALRLLGRGATLSWIDWYR